MIKTRRLTAEDIRKSILQLMTDGNLFGKKNKYDCQPISSFSEIFTGASFKKDTSSTTPFANSVRVLRGGNIQPFAFLLKDDDLYIPNSLISKNMLLQKYDLITPAVTSLENIGKFALINKALNNTVVGGFVYTIRLKSNQVLPKYLLCACSSKYFVNQMTKITKKSGQAFYNMNKSLFSKLLVPLPPLEEQKRIVDKLNKLEPLLKQYEEIENKLSNLENNIEDKLIKSIFNLALQGKLSKQVLTEKTMNYPKTIGQFVLPQNWIWTEAKNLIKVITGISYDKNDIIDNGLRILRGGNIKNYEINLTNSDVYLPINKYLDTEKRILKGDIVIVGSTGSKEIIGNPAFVSDSYKNISIGAFLRILRPIDSSVHKWLSIFYKSEIYREQIRRQTTGTCINNVSKKMLTSMLIPLPPLGEQQRIVTKVNKILSIIK